MIATTPLSLLLRCRLLLPGSNPQTAPNYALKGEKKEEEEEEEEERDFSASVSQSVSQCWLTVTQQTRGRGGGAKVRREE
jgi:hypothetical protein